MGSRLVGLPVRIPAGWHGGTRIGPGSGILGSNAEEEASTRPPAPLALGECRMHRTRFQKTEKIQKSDCLAQLEPNAALWYWG